jgi:hypothetical protein
MATSEFEKFLTHEFIIKPMFNKLTVADVDLIVAAHEKALVEAEKQRDKDCKEAGHIIFRGDAAIRMQEVLNEGSL